MYTHILKLYSRVSGAGPTTAQLHHFGVPINTHHTLINPNKSFTLLWLTVCSLLVNVNVLITPGGELDQSIHQMSICIFLSKHKSDLSQVKCSNIISRDSAPECSFTDLGWNGTLILEGILSNKKAHQLGKKMQNNSSLLHSLSFHATA